MIAVSLLLIAGAVSFLVLGLWQSSSALLGASIAASVLAAVLLVIGVRRTARTAADVADRTRSATRDGGARDGGARDGGARSSREAGRQPARDAGRQAREESWRAAREESRQAAREGGRAPTRERDAAGGPVTAAIPTQSAPPRESAREAAGGAGPPGVPGHDQPDDTAELDELDEDPPDEPAPQQVSPADAARVGRMLTEVLVVDGRPRYHLPGCVHLLSRESEPLPVGEAIELGFTPCSLCEPDSALLADARRV